MSGENKRVKPARVIGLVFLVLILAAGIFIGYRYFRMKMHTAAMPAIEIVLPKADQPAIKGSASPVKVLAKASGQGVSVLEWYLDGILAGHVEGEGEVLSGNWQWLPEHEGTYQLSFLAYADNGAMGLASMETPVISGADVDADGLPDALDECPSEPGPSASKGCALPGDEDADGLAGEADACPDAAGPLETAGCPIDRAADADADGIFDTLDRCPQESGRPDWQGCPISAWSVNTDGDELPDFLDDCAAEYGPRASDGCPLPAGGDADGDSVPDGSDACADAAGSPSSGGCPLTDDRDGDGVADAADGCPDEAGLSDGCPAEDAFSDADLDGVPDAVDRCPEEPGLLEYSGCPMPDDRDGDGLADADDRCPDLPGSAESGGCPMAALPYDAYARQFLFLPFRLNLRESQPLSFLIGDMETEGQGGGGSGVYPDDWDGDGVLDDEDDCDDWVGRPFSNGCPWGGDMNSDGIPDDRDSDGIPDDRDPCTEIDGSCQDSGEISKLVIDIIGFKSDPNWTGVYCYGWTNGLEDYVRIPYWYNMPAVSHTGDSVTRLPYRFFSQNAIVSLDLHCWGQPANLARHSQYLGAMRVNYSYFYWDGQVRKARAYGPDGWFEIWFKITQLSYAIT